jgi:HlyD family secretion protein
VATVRNVLRIPNAALRFKPPEAATEKATPQRTSSEAPTGTASTTATTGTTGSAAGSSDREERRRQWRERMAQSGGSGPFGGTGSFGRRGPGGVAGAAGAFGQATAQVAPRRPATVYILDENKKLQPVQIRTGISDGRYTAVVDGNLKVGDTVVIGLATSKVEGPAAFGGGMGGPGGRPQGGGGAPRGR